MARQSILIVDDISDNRKLIADIVKTYTKYNIFLAKNGKDAISSFNRKKKYHPDLILLDIMMPEMDGYQTAEILKNNPFTMDIPIIFITAKNKVNDKVKAFEIGGVDYISKPFNKHELLARIDVHLKLKAVTDKLKKQNKILKDSEKHLAHLVNEKTKKIGEMTIAMVSALENANLFNDQDTGMHIKRVGEYSALLADKIGMGFDFISKILLYAPLHDVGKVGISDEILKKTGKYNKDEFNLMKEHVIIGGNMLSDKSFDPIAKNIALFHHEKWDGTGYKSALKAKRIPIEARIVAITDVYDALTTRRKYKEPFSEKESDIFLQENAGSHFDPELIKAFFSIKKKILEVKKALQ